MTEAEIAEPYLDALRFFREEIEDRGLRGEVWIAHPENKLPGVATVQVKAFCHTENLSAIAAAAVARGWQVDAEDGALLINLIK